jgi:hypothetical protein
MRTSTPGTPAPRHARHPGTFGTSGTFGTFGTFEVPLIIDNSLSYAHVDNHMERPLSPSTSSKARSISSS